MPHDLIAPTIHLNGTSKEELLDKLTGALTTLNSALNAVALTAPHGRDYYLQGENAHAQARGQHNDRLRRLEEIRNEILFIVRRINNLNEG